MKEYKIGETFLIGRKKFQVVECKNCVGCYFQDNAAFCCELTEKYIGSCYSAERKDGKEVYFKLIEEE